MPGVTSQSKTRGRGCGNSWERWEGECLQVSQVSGGYQCICQQAYPYNYPAITAQLAANELINVTDTSYRRASARVYCDSSSFRCQIQIKLRVCLKTMR